MQHFSSTRITRLLSIAVVFHAVCSPAAAQPVGKAVIERSVMLLCLDVTRDGSVLVTGGDAIRIYNPTTGQLLQRLSTKRLTRTVRFSPAGNSGFASAGDDSVIRFWQVGKREPVSLLKGHSGSVLDLAFLPDGRMIASAGTQLRQGKAAAGEFRLRSTETGKTLQSIDLADRGVGCVAFSKDGKRVAFSRNASEKNGPSTIEVYDLNPWRRVRSIPFTPGFAFSLSFLSDGRKIVIAGGECVPLSDNSCQPTGKLWLAAIDSDQPAKLVTTEECAYFRSASLSPTGDRFAIGTATLRTQLDSRGQVVGNGFISEIQMRRTDTGDLAWWEDGGIGDPYGVTVSADGKLVACCSYRSVLILDANSGKRIRSIDVED
jgi:WD40 repeat protein